jgi:hypothetical protein
MRLKGSHDEKRTYPMYSSQAVMGEWTDRHALVSTLFGQDEKTDAMPSTSHAQRKVSLAWWKVFERSPTRKIQKRTPHQSNTCETTRNKRSPTRKLQAG